MTASKLCRTLAAAALLAAFGAPGFSGGAVAAGPSESNKGGEVRGTARADERAGTHGDQGRDRAEMNKAKDKNKKDTKNNKDKAAPTAPK